MRLMGENCRVKPLSPGKLETVLRDSAPPIDRSCMDGQVADNRESRAKSRPINASERAAGRAEIIAAAQLSVPMDRAEAARKRAANAEAYFLSLPPPLAHPRAIGGHKRIRVAHVVLSRLITRADIRHRESGGDSARPPTRSMTGAQVGRNRYALSAPERKDMNK